MPAAEAACPIVASALTASSSSSTETVTRCAVFQFAGVKDRVFWLPPVLGSVSTVTSVFVGRVSVTVTGAVGSLDRCTM